MTYAAKNKKILHLWWHPHNFGRDSEKNLINLVKILEHYKSLHSKYNFQSITMNTLCEKLGI